MASFDHINNLIEQLQQTSQTLGKIQSNLERIAEELKANVQGTSNIVCQESRLEAIAIIDGRKQVIEDYDEADFDVVFDIVQATLKSRKNPSKHSPLTKCNMAGLGNHRMQILIYMMEHPAKMVGHHNYDLIYGEDINMGKDAFRKSISVLRKILGQKKPDSPYILTVQPFFCGNSTNSKGYKLNKQWNYLLIKNF